MSDYISRGGTYRRADAGGVSDGDREGTETEEER